MSRNGAGSYSLPAGNPVIDGTDITVTWGNDTMNDIATALTNSLAANGETPATANIPLAGYKLTTVGVATALTDAETGTGVQKGTATYLTSVAGTANAITATGPYSMAAYTTGMVLRFKVGTTNTGPTTIAINGLAATPIGKSSDTIPVAAGDLLAGAIVEISYSGTVFQLIGSRKLGENPLGIVVYNHGNSGTTTQDLDYWLGAVHRIKATGNFTITSTAAHWPATGNMGEILLQLVADGTGRTITWPTINWVKSDGSFTTTFASNGVTLQTANDTIDFVLIWSFDGGTTLYGKVLR